MKSLLRLCLITSLLFSQALMASQTHVYSISYADLNGDPVLLERFKGKVVMLNFWATWCPPCIKEMPSMQRLKEQLSDQPFEIVAINMGEDAETVSRFLQQLPDQLTFTILLDEKNSSFKTFKVKGLPMTLLFDQEGKLMETILGVREWDQPSAVSGIEALIRE